MLASLRTLNELLTAGIAITAFSLLLYALSFNLKDRVARTFAIILGCVVIVFVCEAIVGVATQTATVELFLRLQWVGIVFLPAAYVHFSDALLATTGRPSRGRRRRLIFLIYLLSLGFLVSLPFSWLVGPLVENVEPAPHLRRTWLTLIFTVFYAALMVLAGVNFWRASRRLATSASRRRMRYLLAGALSPALGSYPYLLFGSGLATRHPLIFWLAAVSSNFFVSVLLVVMAYAVAFFGVPWPDRVVKRRLAKWLMRGPVTVCTVLSLTTLTRRAGEAFGFTYSAAVPIVMVGSFLILEHLITLAAPIWERWLFHGGDRENIQLVQDLEERLLTSADLREFLESVLAAACDRLQVRRGFLVALAPQGLEMLVTLGETHPFEQKDMSQELLQAVNGKPPTQLSPRGHLFSWSEQWLVPLYETRSSNGEKLLGILGVGQHPENPPDDEQIQALMLLAQRAALALENRRTQQRVVTSLEALTPEVDLIQRLRAAARYDGTEVLTTPPGAPLESRNLPGWVKDALSHYWGGPKLSQSPLLRLEIVQRAAKNHADNPTNALRAILREAIERVRPEGERRFTGEWILYNILELKFLEGRKVREIAMRLAMSEADLYRKQRVAIEAVAKAILEMEQQAREEK
jgi:hypothetical protein